VFPPEVDLPADIELVPATRNGELVTVFLVENKRPRRTYWYIRASAGSRGYRMKGRSRWTVSSLGTDLPTKLIEGLRIAVWNENQGRRKAYVADVTGG